MTKPVIHPDIARGDALGRELTTLNARITAATYRFLVLLREFDELGGWNRGGTLSCAHWLNWRCGIGLNAAREKVRVAHALKDLKKVSAALEKGEISYSKVRALTRVATPDNEDYLLMIARHGTAAHMEGLAQRYRRVKRIEDAALAQAQHEARMVDYYIDRDGSLVFKGRLPPEQGALVLKALEAARKAAEEREKAEAAEAAARAAQADAAERAEAAERDRCVAGPALSGEAGTSEKACRVAGSAADVGGGADACGTGSATNSGASEGIGNGGSTGTGAGTAAAAGVSAETPLRPIPWRLRRADALVEVAENYLSHGAKDSAAAERYQVVVHVSAETLRSGKGRLSELESGPGVSADACIPLTHVTYVITIRQMLRGIVHGYRNRPSLYCLSRL